MWIIEGFLRSSPQTISEFTNNGTLRPSIAELSAITLVYNDKNELDAILLGDGGALYEATLSEPEGKNKGVELRFVRSSSLQIPLNTSYTHVDAESIAAICSVENRKGRFCDLSKNETTFLVGVEKGKTNPAGIFEYFSDGTLKSTQPIRNQSSLLAMLSVDNKNQLVNKGFEALTVSPDQRYLVFATEGYVFADSNMTRARRIVIYDREKEVAMLYKYFVHDEAGNAGVSDIVVLDDHAHELVLMERLYDNKTQADTVELYHVSRSQYNPNVKDATLVNLSEGISAMEYTRRFHESELLKASPLFSFVNHSNITDNYEGMTALGDGSKPHSLVLVSDNNDNENQKTFVTTIGLNYMNTTNPVLPPSPSPHASDSDYDYYIPPGFFLIVISMLLCILLAFYNYPFRNRDHDRLGESEAEAIQIEMTRSDSREASQGTIPLRQEQDVQVI